MAFTTWLHDFWRDPRTQEVLRQVLVTLLLALLSVLGYDRTVAAPRVQALSVQIETLAHTPSATQMNLAGSP